MDQDEEQGLRSIGSLLPQIANSLEASVSMRSPRPPSSGTTGALSPEKGRPSSTGRQLSATRAAEQREIDAVLRTGDPRRINDQAVACLGQLVELSDHCPWTDNPLTMYAQQGYRVSGTTDQVRMAREAFEQFMLPAKASDVVRELTRCRLMTVSRVTDEEEMAMIMSAFVDALADKPGDATIRALREWPKKHKFWPTLAEINELIDEISEPRVWLEKALSLANVIPWSAR